MDTLYKYCNILYYTLNTPVYTLQHKMTFYWQLNKPQLSQINKYQMVSYIDIANDPHQMTIFISNKNDKISITIDMYDKFKSQYINYHAGLRFNMFKKFIRQKNIIKRNDIYNVLTEFINEDISMIIMSYLKTPKSKPIPTLRYHQELHNHYDNIQTINLREGCDIDEYAIHL